MASDTKIVDAKLYDSKGNILKKFSSTQTPAKKNKFNTRNVIIYIPIFTSVVFILAGINAVSKYVYFGINLTFFTYDSKYIFIEVFKFVITWMVIVGIPFLFYKNIYSGFEKLIFKVLIYILMLSGIVYFYGDLIYKYYYNLVPLPQVVILVMIIFALGFLIFSIEIMWNKKIANQFKNFKKNTPASKFKLMAKLIWISINLFNLVIISIIIFTITVCNVFGIPQPNTYTEYSILKQVNESKIVLFKTENRLFVADFEIVDDNNCIIYTKQYQIIPLDNIKLEDVLFKNVRIEKDKLKPQ